MSNIPEITMLYQERLKKWAVVRITADSKRIVLERFRNVADAEGHLRVLRMQMPHEQLMVIFDRPPMSEEHDSKHLPDITLN